MSQEHNHVITKKVVLTAWELVVVKSVSVRPASVSLECWYLTERKHVAFLSSSSYLWKYSRNISMMKLSVFTLRISSWQGRKISVSISLLKNRCFFQQPILILTKYDTIRIPFQWIQHRDIQTVHIVKGKGCWHH